MNQFRPEKRRTSFVHLFVMLRKQTISFGDGFECARSLAIDATSNAGDCDEVAARGWAMIARGLARFAFNWPFHVGFAMIQVFSYFYSHANSSAGCSGNSSSSDECVPTDN